MRFHSTRPAILALTLAAACAAFPAAARAGDREALIDLDRALQGGKVPAVLDAIEAVLTARPAGSTVALARAYESDNAWIRRAAVRAMAVLGDREALAVFLRGMADGDALVRLDACNAAPRFAAGAGAREEIRAALAARLLDDARRGVRVAAALSLGLLGEREAAFALSTAALGDRDPRVRSAALGSLAALAREDAFETLAKALAADPDHRPRVSAAGALGQLGLEEAAGPLAGALKDVSGAVRLAAARALGRLGTPAAVKALDAALELDDEDVHLAAAHSLGAIGTGPALEALRRALFHPSKAARRGAAESLGYLGDRASLELLARMTEDYEPAVRAAAVTALGGLADPRAKLVIRKRLGDRNPEVRARAAEAAGRLADTGLIPELVRLTGPTFSDGERVAAAAALGYLGDAVAANVLLRLLADPSEPVRRAAAAAIGRLGAMSVAGGALGERLLEYEASFVGGARVEFLGALAATRARGALPFFEGEIRRHRERSPGRFACEVGLFLLGDEGRRRCVLEGALGRREGANATLAIVALIAAGDPEAEDAARAAVRSRSPDLRESAALALGVAKPEWAGPLLRRAAKDPHPGVALRARVGLRWLELREDTERR